MRGVLVVHFVSVVVELSITKASWLAGVPGG
jgi:hypothetical protein